MVSKQKPIKSSNEQNGTNDIKDLENEINNVINTCKDIIKNNNMNSKQNTKGLKSVDKNASEITLEKVATDMTNILKDLKDHIHIFKGKDDSFSDVAPKLEETFKRNENKTKGFFKNNQSKVRPNNTKPQSKTGANNNTKVQPKNCSNNTKPSVNQPKTGTNNTRPQSKTGANNDTKTQLQNYSNNTKPSVNQPKTGSNNTRPQSKTGANNDTKVQPQNCSNNTKPQSKNCTNNNTVKPKTTGSANKPKTTVTSRPTSPNTKSNTSKMSDSSGGHTSTTRAYNYSQPPKSLYNPLALIKTEVEKAIRERKTFTIRGTFPAVRRALISRGWVEKLHMSYRDRINEDLKKFQTYTILELVELLRNKDIAENCKKLIKSKLLANHQVDFYWSYNYDAFKECPDNVKITKINRFRREFFNYTSKLGLCNANKKSIWFKIPGIAKLDHPRTYSLAKNGDTPEFIKDFNRTAAASLLKWIVQNHGRGECKILSPSGKVPIEVFDFAINECYKFIKMSEHQETNNDIKEALDYEWNQFLEYFYKTVHIGNHFKTNGEVTEEDMVRKARYILTKLLPHWPYLQMDGIMNIWILKPTNGSQGVGIHICRTLQYIVNTIKANPNRRYIIQKYIERPLLIHNTKFDIRQWFLISSSVPLTIWMYKKCYLRFSSQTYNLRKLHEAIHLTNNSVQSRYHKSNRDIFLPSYSMWDSKQFRNYLSDIGYPTAFDTIIYPGMCQCIIASIIIYQDKMDQRRNCFELYGADFILTEDFKPWLLEINANPALHASTPVTAKMCPAVLEDVIKVVIDYAANPNADTGEFELIYKKDLRPNSAMKDFQGTGTTVKSNYNTPSKTKVQPAQPIEIAKAAVYGLSPQKSRGTESIEYVKEIGMGMRKTLEDLLEILKKEKEKRQGRKSKGVATILSRIITETRESQTEYKNPSRILSEILIQSQILEEDELKTKKDSAKSRDHIALKATSNILKNKKSSSKHSSDIQQKSSKSEPVKKTSTTRREKDHLVTKTSVRSNKSNKSEPKLAPNKNDTSNITLKVTSSPQSNEMKTKSSTLNDFLNDQSMPDKKSECDELKTETGAFEKHDSELSYEKIPSNSTTPGYYCVPVHNSKENTNVIKCQQPTKSYQNTPKKKLWNFILRSVKKTDKQK